MKEKKCQNPSDRLAIVTDRCEIKACNNCTIPQILRMPCLGYQATARLKSALKNGMEIIPNPEYPEGSDYPTIAICQGNRAIVISTK